MWKWRKITDVLETELQDCLRKQRTNQNKKTVIKLYGQNQKGLKNDNALVTTEVSKWHRQHLSNKKQSNSIDFYSFMLSHLK